MAMGLIPGRICVSTVDFVCRLLFRCPFCPHVTAVACKRPEPKVQMAGCSQTCIHPQCKPLHKACYRLHRERKRREDCMEVNNHLNNDPRYTYAMSEKGRALVFNFNYNAFGKECESSVEMEGRDQSKRERGFTIDLSDKRCVLCVFRDAAVLHHSVTDHNNACFFGTTMVLITIMPTRLGIHEMILQLISLE